MKKNVFLITILSTIFGASLIHAEENKGSCKAISKSEAIAVAQAHIKGKALSASKINSRGPVVYKVKVLLDNGRIKTIHVDGCNRSIIQVND